MYPSVFLLGYSSYMLAMLRIVSRGLEVHTTVEYVLYAHDVL